MYLLAEQTVKPDCLFGEPWCTFHSYHPLGKFDESDLEW
jgi:hypothetical protein